MMKTSGSRRISSAIASRNASRMVMVTISVPSGTSGSGSAVGRGAGAIGGADIVGLPSPTGERESATSCAIFGGGAAAFGSGAAGFPRSLPRSAALSPSARMVGIGVVTATVGGAFRDQYLAECAFIGRLDFHGRLVSLDLGDDVAGLDLLTFLFQPFGEVTLFHGGRQRRHQHLDWHGNSELNLRLR